MITFSNLEKMGRLGNQLFQIATCIALAEKNNDDFIFPEWSYKNYFSLNDCWSNNIKPTISFKEDSFNYKEIKINSKNEILDIIGYFQSWKYFNDSKEIIMGLLTPNISLERNNLTSVHIRRGDYLNLKDKYCQLFNSEYYNKAMLKVGGNFIIISDDIDWCKNKFNGNNITYSESKNEVEDLALMISCQNNIIANSSFSWMGAYLNPNPNKIVIAPNNWFEKNLNHNTKDLIPKEWHKI